MSSSAPFLVPGLTEREARIWKTLAHGTPLNISQISHATQLHRPAVYAAIASLKDKKLITTSSDTQRTTYRTTGARALELWRAAHDTAFAVQLKKMTTVVGLADIEDGVRVYHGKEMQRVWEDVLASTPKASVFFRYDGYAPPIHAADYMPTKYYERIEHKRIDRFVITNRSLRKSAYKKRLECASRVLPESFDAFEQGISQFIFGDKIAFIDFNTETAYVIKNKALAAFHAKLFKFVFNALKD